MEELEFAVLHWIDVVRSDLASTTIGALRIRVNGQVCTKVEDSDTHTIRDHVFVPISEVMEWLLIGREVGSHSLATLGGGIPWPPIEITNDGHNVQIKMTAEVEADAARIRYVSSVSATVPMSVFIEAVDDLFKQLEVRMHELASEPVCGWRQEWNELNRLYLEGEER